MFIENHNKTVLDSSRVSWRLGFHYLTIHLTIHETWNKDDRKWHLSLWRKTRHLTFNESGIFYDNLLLRKGYTKLLLYFCWPCMATLFGTFVHFPRRRRPPSGLCLIVLRKQTYPSLLGLRLQSFQILNWASIPFCSLLFIRQKILKVLNQ